LFHPTRSTPSSNGPDHSSRALQPPLTAHRVAREQPSKQLLNYVEQCDLSGEAFDTFSMAWRGRGRSGAMMTHNSEAAKEAREQPDPEMFPARSAIHEITLPPKPTEKELRVLENMRRLNTATLSTPYRLKYTVHSNSVDHNIDRFSMRVKKQAPPVSFQLGPEYHPAELMQLCSKKRRRRYDDDARVLLQRFQEDHEDDLAVGAEDEDGEGVEAEKNEGTDDGNSSSSERDAVSFFLFMRRLFAIFYFVFRT
jgi:hypothetical protein